MKKINIQKLNRSNNDIWLNINEAIKSQNYNALERNFQRLYALQKYYLDLLNFQDIEINQLKDNLESVQSMLNDYEKEWITEVAKRGGIYEAMKERINENYKTK
jgi:hypothetical protein